MLYARGGQQFSSAGQIVPLFMPHLGQKGYFNDTKIGLRGPDVACGPYVAPSCASRIGDNLQVQKLPDGEIDPKCCTTFKSIL